MRKAFIPTDLVISLLGNESMKKIESTEKKKRLQYKDANASIICNNGSLAATKGHQRIVLR